MTTTPENYRSQFGEDKILAEYFGYKTHGCCVEIGAYDGIDCSNSYYFEQLGWECVLVEAIPQLAERARVNRPKSRIIQCAVVAPGSTGCVEFFVAEDIMTLSSISIDSHNEKMLQDHVGRVSTQSITVQARTIDEILQESGITEIDFITIDVEGHEYDALLGFDLDRWNPSILILERNQSSFDWRIIRRLFNSRYLLFKTTGVNDWYRPVSQNQNATFWLAYGWGLIRAYSVRRLPLSLKVKLRNVTRSLTRLLGKG